MKPLCLILVLFFGFLTRYSNAQDIHFSQYNASLLNLSPGYTGLFDGDCRVGAIYRSQWSSVPVSYSTFSMHGETRLKPPALKKDMIGLGLLFNSDRAGDARYGTNQVYLNANYIFLARPDSSLIITLGANGGFCNVGFDNTKMTFNNQYDGFQFNSGLPTGESFGRTQRNFFDFNAGSAVQYIHNKKHRISYALSVNHISRPVITYQGNDLSRIDLKVTNCASYSRPINQRTDILLEALWTLQGKNYELIPHLGLKYYMDKDINRAVLGGVCLRARDAVVARVGYNQGSLQSGMSYDINISKFIAATNRRGAFELFINYVFRSKPAFVAKKRACPIFM